MTADHYDVIIIGTGAGGGTLARHLAPSGKRILLLERGRDLCEKLLAYSSPLGLYAEEIDPRSGRHLGNFPQAFTHLALINAVMHVIRAEEALEASFSEFTRDPARAAQQDEPPAPSAVD